MLYSGNFHTIQIFFADFVDKLAALEIKNHEISM